MMTKTYETESSKFYCTKCGNEGVPIIRKKGQLRKGGHLKRLYCIYCREIINHVEINSTNDYTLQDFKTEFENGVFVDGIRKR